MRNVLSVVVAVVVVASGGYALCAAAGWGVQPASVIIAGAAAVAGAAAGFVPLYLARGTDQAGMAQAGLVGTVLHLFGCLVGVMVNAFVLKAGYAAVYWAMAFYTATLVALVVGLNRAVRAAPAARATPKQ